jgi:spore coat protein U-like protein
MFPRCPRARVAVALFLASGTLAAGSAAAATSTGTLGISASVGRNCLFSSGPFTLGFGTYTPGAGNRDRAATLRVGCTNGITFQVALNGGGTGNIANRQMSATGLPSEKLAYQLYTNAARTTVWGDGTSGSVRTLTGRGVNRPQSLTVHGRIPDAAANQSAAPRNDYLDTVTITVTY